MALNRFLLFALLSVISLQACGGGSPAAVINSPSPPSQPSQPQFISIDAPGAGSAAFLGTTAQDINANNDIAGLFTDANNTSHAFLLTSGGTLTAFEAPGAGLANSQGTDSQGVNDSGTIVGSFLDQNYVSHGYIRARSGVFTTFDVPNAYATLALGIDDGGDVTGEFLDSNSFAHGFVRYSNGTLATFDVPGSGGGSYAGTIPSRINAAGSVVGYFTDPNSARHGFLRTPDGTITVFDAPGAASTGGSGTMATDINATGIIVGVLYGPLFNGSGHRSFLRDAVGNITVFDPPGVGPPPPGDGGTGSAASSINSSGTLAGTFTDPNEVMHGYVRNPDGSFVTIDAPGAATTGGDALGTNINRINSAGAMAGVYFTPNRARHGFARE